MNGDREIARRITQAREAASLSKAELARKIGVTRSAAGQWENADSPTTPTGPNLQLIAKVTGVNAEWLSHGVGEPTRAASSNLQPERFSSIVQCMGVVAAGDWVDAYEWPRNEWQALPLWGADPLPGREKYALQVKGESMNLRYPDNSYVICVKHSPYDDPLPIGKCVIVERHAPNGLVEATIKELVQDGSGDLWLWPRSSDPRYQAPLRS